jgi:hypothetical protein
LKNIRCQDGHLWCWAKNHCTVMWCQTAREGAVVVEAVDVEDDLMVAGLPSSVNGTWQLEVQRRWVPHFQDSDVEDDWVEDPGQLTDPMCGAVSFNHFGCTLLRNHEGPHQAGTGQRHRTLNFPRVVDSWV